MAGLISFEHFKDIWERKPMVVFDTSALLDLYGYSSETIENILRNFETIADSMWLPAQVIEEFESEKERVRESAYNKYKNASRDVTRILKNTITDLDKLFSHFGKFKFPNINDLKDKMERGINELLKEAEQYRERVRDEIERNSRLLREDVVGRFVESLKKNGNVGDSFSISKLLEVYKEGEERYKYSIPPGYRDAVKDDSDETKTKKFGDLIIWKQLLDKAKAENSDVIFVTNDNKEDWWEVINGEPRGPRKELIREFREYCGHEHELVMLTFPEFHKHISLINNINAHHASIELNLDRICRDFVRMVDWQVAISDKLEAHLIHSGELDGYLSGGIVGDVEIEEVLEPILSDLNVDFDENKALVEGEFEVELSANVEIQYSKNYSKTTNATITVNGRIGIEFKVDYEDPENLVNYEDYNLEVGCFEVRNCAIDVEETDLCQVCRKRPGVYIYKENRLIGTVCQACAVYCDVCTGCGIVFPRGELNGAPCADCRSKDWKQLAT